MKTFQIDMSSADGVMLLNGQIQFNGKMAFTETAGELEGDENSRVDMSIPVAAKLADFLNTALASAKKQGIA